MFLILLIISLLLVVQLSLSRISFVRDPQLRSLESGFEGLKQGVIMRSSFFMLAILFVLFDIELILLFPLVVFFTKTFFIKAVIFLIMLVLVLIVLMFEWYYNGLKWHR